MTRPLVASTIEPTGIDWRSPSGTNLFEPGSLIRTRPDFGATVTLLPFTGVGPAGGGGGGGRNICFSSGAKSAETQFENSEVPVFGTSVAVRVKKWASGRTSPSSVAEKAAAPESSVSTSSPVLARRYRPWPNPDGSHSSLLKNSRS